MSSVCVTVRSDSSGINIFLKDVPLGIEQSPRATTEIHKTVMYENLCDIQIKIKSHYSASRGWQFSA